MRKRYVVCLNSVTDEQSKLLNKFIQDNGFGWWHWIANTWLLSDSAGKFTAEQIRDHLMETFPGVNLLVLELRGSDDTWSGFGPKNEKQNMFKWLHNNW